MAVPAKAVKQDADSLLEKGHRKMDEKKVREAIKAMENQIAIIQKIPKYLGLKEKTDKKIEERQTAIEALEKQLPKKVDMRTEYKDLNGAMVCFEGFCPSCGCAVEYYRNKSCNRCTQMLDWSKN